MKNVLLDVSYDGTNYSGYQIQPNGISIEEKLRNSLEKSNIKYLSLTSSGRTDAGVHALHQKVNFFTDSSIPEERFKYILNQKLPEDIRILESSRVENDFHSRYSAIGKHYTYYINENEFSTPFVNKYSWNYSYPIDYKRLDYLSHKLVGEHDFRSFMKTGSSVKTTVRNLYLIKPSFENNLLRLDFFGNGFLYNMVRILTGTLLQYSSGHLKDLDLNKVFKEPNRDLVGKTAPAKGLFLSNVFYDQDQFQKVINDFNKKSFL